MKESQEYEKGREEEVVVKRKQNLGGGRSIRTGGKDSIAASQPSPPPVLNPC